MLNVIHIPNLLSRIRNAKTSSDCEELKGTAKPPILARRYPIMSVLLKPILFYIAPLRIVALSSDTVEA